MHMLKYSCQKETHTLQCITDGRQNRPWFQKGLQRFEQWDESQVEITTLIEELKKTESQLG